jgi:hypothetical protein
MPRPERSDQCAMRTCVATSNTVGFSQETRPALGTDRKREAAMTDGQGLRYRPGETSDAERW